MIQRQWENLFNCCSNVVKRKREENSRKEKVENLVDFLQVRTTVRLCFLSLEKESKVSEDDTHKRAECVSFSVSESLRLLAKEDDWWWRLYSGNWLRTTSSPQKGHKKWAAETQTYCCASTVINQRRIRDHYNLRKYPFPFWVFLDHFEPFCSSNVGVEHNGQQRKKPFIKRSISSLRCKAKIFF